jgi:hypothetical protein
MTHTNTSIRCQVIIILKINIHTGFKPDHGYSRNPKKGATTLNIITLSIMTLSIMTLSKMTLSIMALSIMTLSIMTLIIMGLFAILSINNTHHYSTAECHYA